MRRLILLTTLLLPACNGGDETATTTTSPSNLATLIPTTGASSSTTTTTKQVYEFSGRGQQNTDPVRLAGGAYISRWKGTGSCFYGASLQLANGSPGGSHDLGQGDGPGEGTQNLYGVAAGEYFVHMITGPAPGCPWTLTLEQR